LDETRTPRRPLLYVGVLALVAGFAEAGALVVIVALGADALGGAADAAGAVGLQSLRPSEQVGLGAVLIAVALAANVVASWTLAKISTGAVARLRFDLMSAHVGASARSQEQMSDGKMPELTGLGAYQAETAIGSVGAFVTSGALLLAYLAIAILTEPVAAVATLASGGVLILLTRPVAHRARSAMRRYVDRSADLLQWCAQVVELKTELRVFGVEHRALDELARRNREAARAGHRARFLLSASPSLYQSVALGLVLTGVLIARESTGVEPTALAAVTVLLVRALSLVQRISLALQGVGASAPHLEDVSSTTREFLRSARSSGTLVGSGQGHLTVDDVSFAYDDGIPVLEQLSFSVAPGESVAIVGPSGGGKSTLLKLLLGLLQPDSGAVRIDGVDITDLDDGTLRTLVALVPQENRLLLGSVAENVAFLRTFEPAAIEEALRSAAIEDLPAIATGDIGAGASSVSGGQRQRIGIARALVGEPTILLLDEPTSALDHVSEHVVNTTLRSVRGSMTVIVVAHRPSTVAACDRVLLLEEGRLRADGLLPELLQSEPYLRAMFDSP
jgi:ABC-type multidrug transport system fused ATPase/permease subunit